MPDEPTETRVLDIRKYPNRRYYDSTRRCHVTLEDIHGLVLKGWDVHVTDSKTGGDITGKVLAQIILDFDPVKLSAFPSALLHQVIRSNEQLVRDFVDTYFNRALEAFINAQRQFDSFLRQSVGLSGIGRPSTPDFARLMFGTFSPPAGTAQPGRPPTPSASAEPGAPEDAGPSGEPLRDRVEQLQEQVRQLTRELRGRKSRKA